MSLPSTSKEFERFLADNKASWPQELQDAGQRAYGAMWRIDNNPPSQNNIMEERKSPAWLLDMKVIMDFAEAYGAWKAKGPKQ